MDGQVVLRETAGGYSRPGRFGFKAAEGRFVLDDIYARNYQGTDPTVTVGDEVNVTATSTAEAS